MNLVRKLGCLLLFAGNCSTAETHQDTQQATVEKIHAYGFLSTYSEMPEEDAREKIRVMVEDFGIHEFQFYDWFADYSTPTSGEQWKDPFFKRRSIFKKTIQIYIDEIHKSGGKAWAYVQAAGSENPKLDSNNNLIKPVKNKKGERYRHADKIPVYYLNAALAQVQVDVWADAVKNLGFDGIHWDTLGSFSNDKSGEAEGVLHFLEISKKELGRRRLLQTLNFIDMHWLDQNSVKLVEFPYCEAWSVKPDGFLKKMSAMGSKGVFVKYASYLPGDRQTQLEGIVSLCKLMTSRGSTVLIVGDGHYRLRTEYFPARIKMDKEDISMVQTCLLPPESY